MQDEAGNFSYHQRIMGVIENAFDNRHDSGPAALAVVAEVLLKGEA
jgi:hypothetical protein